MSAAVDTSGWSFDTLAVRAGQERSQFGEHSEALYLTSSFVFENAAQAAARFSGEEPGNVYARFTNPTVSAMQTRLAALDIVPLAESGAAAVKRLDANTARYSRIVKATGMKVD